MKFKARVSFTGPGGRLLRVGEEFEAELAYGQTLMRRRPPWVDMIGGNLNAPLHQAMPGSPHQTQSRAPIPPVAPAPAPVTSAALKPAAAPAHKA